MTDTALPVDDQGIVDFTLPMEPKRFRIGADIFTAPALMAPIKLARLASLGSDLAALDFKDEQSARASIERIAGLFQMLIGGASGQLFHDRLMSSGDEGEPDPIDIQRQAIPALQYLIEAYGVRPTEQSSPLLANAVTGDSTDGAPAAASTGE